MPNWKSAVVTPGTTLRDATIALDKAALQIVMVVNANGCLAGTITDGDLRRAILAGKSMDEPAVNFMKSTPVAATTDTSRDELIRLMKLRDVRRVPVVDAAGHVVGLELLERLIDVGDRHNTVVLMVGGLGTRLRPKTETVPKPMLEVGGRPILERIIEGFAAHGFNRFVMALNYRGEMIEDYFGAGERHGVQIRYVHEQARLGTAGALGLLDEVPEEPFFVMNGDVLTDCNFEMMLEFHKAEAATLTMAVREYDFQVPFGVVNLSDRQIASIDEKPVQSFFVNAGIYILEPQVLRYIPQGEVADMPTVVQRLIADGKGASAFPLREAWIDVGRDEDYQRADTEYGGAGK